MAWHSAPGAVLASAWRATAGRPIDARVGGEAPFSAASPLRLFAGSIESHAVPQFHHDAGGRQRSHRGVPAGAMTDADGVSARYGVEVESVKVRVLA